MYETTLPVFLTWRLAGSLPAGRAFSSDSTTSGQAFAALDHLLDQGRCGPAYLSKTEIAEIVVESIHYHANALCRYELQAYAVMPNHVHMLVLPRVPIPKLMRTLKSITGRRCNQILGISNRPFWAEETFDRVVRNATELSRIVAYIENNPVKGGLASMPQQFRWSSAWKRE